MNKLKEVQIGLIGCGRWGRFILRDLKSCGAKVHVFVRSEISYRNANDYGADSIVTNLKDLPDSIDGFVVATTTSSHYSVVKQLLSTNKPIYVEKPFCTSSKELREVLALAPKRIFIMHKWRYHPGINKIREYIDKGDLGEVLSINLKRNQWGSPHQDVNTLWIHLPHDLSIIYHLLDHLPPINYRHILKDHNGKIIGINARLGNTTTCLIEQNICTAVKERSINVHFEDGVIQMTDPLSDHLILRRGSVDEKGEKQKIYIDTKMPLLAELESFINYIRNPDLPLLSTLSDEVIIIDHIEEMIEHSI